MGAGRIGDDAGGKKGLTGLLVTASVVLGLWGVVWLLVSIGELVARSPYGFPLGWGGVLGGLMLFVAGLELMRVAKPPDQASNGSERVRTAVLVRRDLRLLLILMSIALIFIGALLSFQVALGVFGVVVLSFGVGGIQRVRRRLRR
jgi:hypothetical protein